MIFRFLGLSAVLALGLLGACNGHRANAVKAYQHQLSRRQELQAESVQAYRKGMEAHRAGDLVGAVDQLRQAVLLDDRNTPAWMALGVACFERDELFEAANAFDRAWVLAPDRYEPVYNLACVLESAGKFAKAIERYEQALKLAPEQPEVLENLARCYIASGEAEKAKPLIEQALKTELRPEWQVWLQTHSSMLSSAKGDGQ